MSNLKKFRIKSFKTDSSLLKIKGISLKLGNKIILDHLNIELNEGQILGLLGPNGAGKSTLFNLIIGIIKPDTGSIIIGSEIINNFPINIRAKKFKIGFVPQHGGYFQNLTVYENLRAVGELTIKSKEFREEKINSSILKFELDNLRNTKAEYLSGGQKKKLVIAMALISSPKILLLDEPFAALDVMTIKKLQNIIINLQTSDNVSIILCDHQARDLLDCVDTAAIINNGKVIAKGTPSNLIHDKIAKNVYFGESFKIN
jgi:lipopolysaccharide export system ATP-binding protein